MTFVAYSVLSQCQNFESESETHTHTYEIHCCQVAGIFVRHSSKTIPLTDFCDKKRVNYNVSKSFCV